MHYAIELHNITSINYNPHLEEYAIVTHCGPLSEADASALLGVAVEERGCEEDGTYYFMIAS